MINGIETGVQLFIDSGLKSCQQIYVHPLVNDRTLGITLEGLQVFFEKIKVEPVLVDLEQFLRLTKLITVHINKSLFK